MHAPFGTLAAIPVVIVTVCAQQTLSVPASYDALDAPSLLWLSGTVSLRQQTIIDARHLQSILGRDLIALSWRRDAGPEVFFGGVANLTVQLGTTMRDSLSASPVFSDNLAGGITVLSGPVQVPTAPAAPGPSASWDASCSIRVPFSTPFHYAGGNLVVDVLGQTDLQQPVSWWPVDAAREAVAGTVQNVGDGCGVYGGLAHHQWAGVFADTLLPGSTAEFTAWGTPGGLAVAFFGVQAAANQYLLADVLPGAASNCSVHLSNVISSYVTTFEQPLHPVLTYLGGPAYVLFQIPNASWAFGASFGTQWLDMQQSAVSNALQWTIPASAPTLGMAIVQGLAADASGVVSSTMAHVIHFELQ